MTSNSRVKLSELIAPPFYELHRLIKKNAYTHYMLSGGRGSTKSSFIGIEIPYGIMHNPGTHAVVFRKVKDTLRESVFEQLQWGISVLGVEEYWQASLSPLRLTYKPTGQVIMFRGMDDAFKAKSIKAPFGYFKYIWFEEYDQFDGQEQIRTTLQSVMRGGKNYVVFRSYNPPKSINSWVNQEALEERSNTYKHHSTYLGVPAEWLGEPFLLEAEHLKETKPKAYEHEYLGVATGTGGQVFDNVVIRTITNEELASFDHIRQGLDWGFAADPFAYVKMHVDKTRRRLFIFDEIYQVGLSNSKSALMVISKNPMNQQIIGDSAEPKSIADYKEFGIRLKGAKKGPDSVDYGIKYLQSFDEIVIDPQRCPNAKREFTSYELERDKNGNFKGTYPDKNNHTIDAARYALEDDMPRKGKTRIGGN